MIEIVDAQVHTWTHDCAEFPWQLDLGDVELDRRVAAHFSAETMPPARLLAGMNDAGVDAAIVVSPTLYGSDMSYARSAVELDPERLAFVGPADGEEQVRTWRDQSGALAIRVPVYSDETLESVERGALRVVLAAAERYDVPVCVYAPARLARVELVARAFPDLQLVVDHLGLPQPSPVIPVVEGDGFAGLPELLRLAVYPNVAVKATGVPSLSREPFPFRDVWGPLLRVVDAFGCERVMWGTDVTRIGGLATYADSVAFLREIDGLGASELESLYGATARRIFRWPR